MSGARESTRNVNRILEAQRKHIGRRRRRMFGCALGEQRQNENTTVLFEDLESMPRRGSNSTQVDRNALERERRMYMKDLFSRLAFLVPTPPSEASLPKLLDQATTHVKQLKQRVEMLKQRKQLVEGKTDTTGAGIRDLMTDGSRSSVITVCDMGSILQICLTSGLNKKFMLYQVIDVLVEEAAQVVALSYSIIRDRIFYTIHVQAVSPRIGIETSRVEERLQELIF